MSLSNSLFDPDLAHWQDYLPFLQQLTGRDFPNCDQLNALLPKGLSSGSGKAIRFVPSTQLANDAYERRIYTTGQVSTRPGNWHDIFNALAWSRFPAIKAAMNSLHFHAWTGQEDGSRGQLRDALTLFDECGVIVFSNNLKILNALAQRRWSDAFLHGDFSASVQLSICGHAMLEKYLAPYKSMTAKALLIQVDENFLKLPKQEILTNLDTQIAQAMLSDRLLTKPSCLSPLPLAGVPGWWPDAEQNHDFYLDPSVFRAPPADLQAAPINYL